jgi:hypothetical protein
MIRVYIADNGDVAMTCNTCGKTVMVPIGLAQSVFWELHIGSALLLLLGHCDKEHR